MSNKYYKQKECKNKKGVAPIVSGVAITIVAIIFMMIIVNFAIPYFNTLQDLTKYRNNKANLLLINDTIEDLKTADVNSYKKIFIHPNNTIFVDSNNNIIEITQEIKDYQFYSNFKDNLNYGNLNISKKQNNFVYTLNLDNIELHNNLNILDNRQEINFKVVDYNNITNKPIIEIKRESLDTQNTSNYWYSENWPYIDSDNNWSNRIKINIDKNINENKINDFLTYVDFQFYTSNDLSKEEVIFTASDGITKLDREIISLLAYQSNSYYIEEELDGNLHTWIKTTIPANSTKTLYIQKEDSGYIPDGEKVFLFFDNFEDNDLNTDKWQGETSYCSEENEELILWGNNTEIYSKEEFGDNTILKTKLIQRTYGDFDSGPGYITDNDTGIGVIIDHSTANTEINNLWHSTPVNEYDVPMEVNVWNSLELIKNNNTYTSIWNVGGERSITGNGQTSSYVGLISDQDGSYGSSAAAFDYVFLRKYVESEPTVEVEEVSTNRFKIKVTNTSDEDLSDYQVKIPNDILQVESTTDSLNLEDEVLANIKAWVNIPRLKNNSDSYIYMYYGNEEAYETNSKNTWNEDSQVTLHLNEEDINNNSNNITIFDSTSNNNNFLTYNFENGIFSKINSNGKLSSATTFNGSFPYNDYLLSNNSTLLNNINDQFTISAWVKSKNNYDSIGQIKKDKFLDRVNVERENDTSLYPEIIHIKEEIYAVTYASGDRYGKIKTYEIDVNGDIEEIDNFIFEKTNGIAFSEIIKINNNTLAISYITDMDNYWHRSKLKTLKIDDDGKILGVVNTKILGKIAENLTNINHVYENIYSITTRVYGAAEVTTLEIDDNGLISNIIDFQKFTPYTHWFDVTKGEDNLFVIAYYGPDADGWVSTFEIDNNGYISNSYIDSFEYDPVYSYVMKIEYLGNNIFGVVARDVDADGQLRTINIDTNGTINGLVDELEYETSYNYYPELKHHKNNIYMVSYTGPGSDGYLVSLEIDINGNISDSIIDKWEYDVYNSYYPEIIDINGTDNRYALVKYGYSYNIDKIKIFEIEEDGNFVKTLINEKYIETWDNAIDTPNIITLDENTIFVNYYRRSDSQGVAKTYNVDDNGKLNELDTLNFDIYGIYSDIIKISPNIIAIAYAGSGSDGWLTTISYDNNGKMSIIDSFEFDTSYGYYPSIIEVYENVYAIAYYGYNEAYSGWLKTVEILPDGTITPSIIDEWKYESERAYYPKIKRLSSSDDLYTIAYRYYDTTIGYDGTMISFRIDNNGTIDKNILDKIIYEPTYGDYPNIEVMADYNFSLFYYGPSGDGWMKTFSTDTNGTFNQIDTWEYDTAYAYRTKVKKIDDDNLYLLAYQGTNIEINTFRIEDTGIIQKNNIYNNSLNTDGRDHPNFAYLRDDLYAFVYRNYDYTTRVATTQIDANEEGISGNYYKFADHSKYQQINKIEDDVFAITYIDEEDYLHVNTFKTINNDFLDKNILVEDLNLNLTATFLNVNKIKDNVLTLTYRGETGTGNITTIYIDELGNIEIKDTYQHSTSSTSYLDLIALKNNKYLIAYTNSSSKGEISTLEIDNIGNITHSLIDNYLLEDQECYDIDLERINEDYFVISFRGPGEDGYVTTFQVEEDTGIITKSKIDTYEFDTTEFEYEPNITKMNNNIFILTYHGYSSELFGRTLHIDDTGNITKEVKDTIRLNTYYNIYYSEPIKINENKLIIAYNETDIEPYLTVIDVDKEGNITPGIDVYKIDGKGEKLDIIYSKNNKYLVAYNNEYNKGIVRIEEIISSNLIYTDRNFSISISESNAIINLEDRTLRTKLIDPTSWNYLTITYNKNLDSNNLKLYINGILLDSKNINIDLDLQNKDITIGKYYSGMIDEFRIYNTEKSSDWIKTEYNNQNDPNTYITVSQEETLSID